MRMNLELIIPDRVPDMTKGVHAYAMHTGKANVKKGLDTFYNRVDMYRARYRILGTRVDGRRSGHATFVIIYEVY